MQGYPPQKYFKGEGAAWEALTRTRLIQSVRGNGAPSYSAHTILIPCWAQPCIVSKARKRWITQGSKDASLSTNWQNISTTKTNTYPSYTLTSFLFLTSYLCMFNVLDGPSVLCGPKVANALAFEWFSSVQEMKFLERGSFPSNTLCGLSVTFLSSKKAASDIWIWRFLRTSFSNSARMLRACFFPFFHVIISLTAKWLVDGWRYCTGMLEWFYHQNNFSCRGIPSWYFLPRPRLWFSSAACGGRSVVSSLHPALPFALRCRWVRAAGWDNEFISCRQPSSCHITMPFSHYWQRQDLKQWRRSKRPCNPETSAGQQLGRLLTCTSTSSLQGLCFSCHQEMSLSYLVVGILQRQWELLGVPAERSVSALCVTVSAVCLLTSALTDGSLATSALGSVRPCAGLGGCFVLHSFLLLLEFHFICFLSAKIWIQT